VSGHLVLFVKWTVGSFPFFIPFILNTNTCITITIYYFVIQLWQGLIMIEAGSVILTYSQ